MNRDQRNLTAVVAALITGGLLNLSAQDERQEREGQVREGQARGIHSQNHWKGHPTIHKVTLAEGEVRPHSWVRDEFIGPDAARPGAVRSGPGGFWPADMQSAYGINGIAGLPALANGLSAGGAGITVAIVDAYDSPNALADLNTFSTQFGLPRMNKTSGTPCTPAFSKVNQSGGTTPPAYNSGWEVEINLDVQWIHAIAPCANILLVEAASANSNNLLTAVLYAGAHASVVSMSWGGGEFRGESIYDQYIFGASNVTYLASSGDTGGVVEWPSVSKNVLAVGGTNLPASTKGGLGTGVEVAWDGSGGGCTAQQEPAPTVETVIHYPAKCTGRGVPDVSASGGANSAVSVLASKQGGWYTVYGTSLSCPMWAGIVAIADGLRKKSGKTTLSYNTLADLYYAYTNSSGSYFTDITTGAAGANKATAGWDFVTGIGSPKTKTLVPYLVAAP